MNVKILKLTIATHRAKIIAPVVHISPVMPSFVIKLLSRIYILNYYLNQLILKFLRENAENYGLDNCVQEPKPKSFLVEVKRFKPRLI